MPPVVIVPAPVSVPGTRAAPSASSQHEGTLSDRWDDIFAEALASVSGNPIYNRDLPTDLYTDGSCSDNGRPVAAAGWGVHVHNSDQLGDHYGALPVQVQTNNRAELAAVEAALHLAWNSSHRRCRVFADCNLACLGISNNSDEWSWKSALGVRGWLHNWELNGWRNASGKRVRHTDIWKRILRGLRLFEHSPTRSVEVHHVKAHNGEKGNERADKLAKEGSQLRFKLMELAAPWGWFQRALGEYWGNRKTED